FQRTCRLIDIGRMGRLLAAILFLGACGDNLVDPTEPSNPGGTTDGTDVIPTEPAPRLVPQLCGVVAWTTENADPKDISIAQQTGGITTVLEVPQAGGDMTAYLLDPKMSLVNTVKGTQIQSGMFTTVSTAKVGDRLVAGGIDGDAIQIAMVGSDL